MSDPITVDVGGVWDYGAWEVRFDAEAEAYWSKQARWEVPEGGVWPAGHYVADWSDHPCPHAGNIRELPPYHPEHHPDEKRREWTVPRVVVAYNEAGFSSTGVCMDCILDWAKSNA